MDVQLKTASFGGYDKKAVETYIEDLNMSHEKEVSELKASVLKLSETVKNLHTMREVNLNESSSTIDNLKKVNDDLQVEVTQLKDKLEAYRVREEESASRYESISRTLLEARESADTLVRQTDAECDNKRARVEAECEQLTNETTAACDKMMNDTTEECERMHAETVAACDKLNAETQSACQEMKESTYANCESLKRKTKEETDTLREETEYSCRVLNEQTIAECDALKVNTTAECEDMRNQARIEAYNVRMSVKRECESVSEYMAQLYVAVDNVVSACNETKAVADQAFPDLSNQM